MVSIPLSTVFFAEIERKYSINFVVLIIFILALVGTFNLYNSPYKLQPNQQITYAELDGFEWFLKNKDTNIKIASIQSVSFYRFADGILGITERENRRDISKDTSIYGDYKAVLPDHFNYKLNNTLGNSIDDTRYIHLSTYDRILYSKVWPNLNRYNEEDFLKLNHDKSVEKLYSNGDLDIYLIGT